MAGFHHVVFAFHRHVLVCCLKLELYFWHCQFAEVCPSGTLHPKALPTIRYDLSNGAYIAQIVRGGAQVCRRGFFGDYQLGSGLPSAGVHLAHEPPQTVFKRKHNTQSSCISFCAKHEKNPILQCEILAALFSTVDAE
eukprot:4499253-Amphidinium_carterae.1